MPSYRVAVVGAGPAGLVAAIAGRRLGLDVRVYEQAPDFRRVGGGLMMHSNGLRVLDALDLLDGFLPHLRFTQEIELRSNSGRVLSRTDLAEIDVPHNHAAVVRRYQLQEHLLASAVREGVPVEFGRRLVAVEGDGPAVTLNFEGGGREAADVVIAADGTHSRVRQALWPEAEERPVGEAYLRAVAPVRTESSAIREFWAPDGRRFGACPLPGAETYFFCTVPLGQWRAIQADGLYDWIESWADFGTEVLGLVRAVRDWGGVNYSELREIRLDRWHRPPFFLVGDAAHAMTPNLGQGANSAMVDSLVLLRLLAEAEDLNAVAQEHEAVRLEQATQIQTAARVIGRLAQLRSWPARWVRNWAMGLAGAIPAARRSALRTATGSDTVLEPYLAPVGRAAEIC